MSSPDPDGTSLECASAIGMGRGKRVLERVLELIPFPSPRLSSTASHGKGQQDCKYGKVIKHHVNIGKKSHKEMPKAKKFKEIHKSVAKQKPKEMQTSKKSKKSKEVEQSKAEKTLKSMKSRMSLQYIEESQRKLERYFYCRR